jgi:chromosome segregation ATPase
VVRERCKHAEKEAKGHAAAVREAGDALRAAERREAAALAAAREHEASAKQCGKAEAGRRAIARREREALQTEAAAAMEQVVELRRRCEATEAKLEKSQRKLATETARREQLSEACDRLCEETNHDRARVRTQMRSLDRG